MILCEETDDANVNLIRNIFYDNGTERNMLFSMTADGKLHIRNMKVDDLDFASECTAIEGWASETREELDHFLGYDAEGCFIAEWHAQKVGMCIGTSYGVDAFLGELIVIKQFRERGIGQRLLQHTLGYLKKKGAKNIFLDSTLNSVGLYKKIGFREICISLRFEGQITGVAHSNVYPIKMDNLAKILELDRQIFGADRSFFIKQNFIKYPQFCLMMTQDEEIEGYVMARPGRNILFVGPWIVCEGCGKGQYLLESIGHAANKAKVRMGVLESNSRALACINTLGYLESVEPSWRMVLGPSSPLGMNTANFTIASAARG